MSKEVTHDAHRRYIQRFVAGARNSGLEIKDKEEKQMIERILVEVVLPKGNYCVTDESDICPYLSNFWRLKEEKIHCGLFRCEIEGSAFAGTVPIKCDACMNAGRVMGGYVAGTALLNSNPAPTCTLDGDCNG